MFCTQCGKEIREGLKFCPGCGAPVKTATQPAGAQPVNPQATDVQQSQVQTPSMQQTPTQTPNIQQAPAPVKKKGSGAIIALIVVLILIIIALIGVSFAEFWITGGKETIYETFGISVESEEEQDEDEAEDEDSQSKKEKSKKEEDKDESEEMKDDAEEDEETEAEDTKEAEEDEAEAAVEEAVVEEAPAEEVAVEEIAEEPEEEPSEYILEYSDSKYLTEDDLEGMTKEECRLARNELYARHGRKFDDEGLQNYFNSCSWYHGTIDASDFSESMLSDIEIANRDLIVEYEKEMGYR